MKRILFVSGFILNISILIYAGTIKNVKPSGGSFLRGTPIMIGWKAKNTQNPFRITLWRDNEEVGVIDKNVSAGNGKRTYEWIVGKTKNGMAPSGTGYKIKVKEKTVPNFAFSKNSFAIKPRFKPPPGFGKGMIKVTKPAKGDKWRREGTYIIKWETEVKQKFNIDLYDDDGKKYIQKIGEYTPSSLGGMFNLKGKYSYPWHIPGNLSVNNYTVRVSAFTGKVDGFSSLFRVILSGKGKKTITIPGETVNKGRIITHKLEGEMSMQCTEDADPGPGKMRVGRKIDLLQLDTKCVKIYRSFVYFNLSNIKKGKKPFLAKISYKKFMGCNGATRLYLLKEQWNGDALKLFTVLVDEIHNPNNCTGEVQYWLDNLDKNFGVVFAYHNESTAVDYESCLGFYENINLVLEFLDY